MSGNNNSYQNSYANPYAPAPSGVAPGGGVPNIASNNPGLPPMVGGPYPTAPTPAAAVAPPSPYGNPYAVAGSGAAAPNPYGNPYAVAPAPNNNNNNSNAPVAAAAAPSPYGNPYAPAAAAAPSAASTNYSNPYGNPYALAGAPAALAAAAPVLAPPIPASASSYGNPYAVAGANTATTATTAAATSNATADVASSSALRSSMPDAVPAPQQQSSSSSSAANDAFKFNGSDASAGGGDASSPPAMRTGPMIDNNNNNNASSMTLSDAGSLDSSFSASSPSAASPSSAAATISICVHCGDVTSDTDFSTGLCRLCTKRGVVPCSNCQAAFAEPVHGSKPGDALLCMLCAQQLSSDQKICVSCNSAYASENSTMCDFCQQSYPAGMPAAFASPAGAAAAGAAGFIPSPIGGAPAAVAAAIVAPEDLCKNCAAAEATTNAGYCDYCAKAIEANAKNSRNVAAATAATVSVASVPPLQQQQQQHVAPPQPMFQAPPAGPLRHPCMTPGCCCVVEVPGTFCTQVCQSKNQPCPFMTHFPNAPRGVPCKNAAAGCKCDSYNGNPSSACGFACGKGQICGGRWHTRLPENIAAAAMQSAMADRMLNDQIRTGQVPPPVFVPPGSTAPAAPAVPLPPPPPPQAAAPVAAVPATVAAPPRCATANCPCDAAAGFRHCSRPCAQGHGPCATALHKTTVQQCQQALQQRQAPSTAPRCSNQNCPCDAAPGYPHCSKWCLVSGPCKHRTHVSLPAAGGATVAISAAPGASEPSVPNAPKCATANCPCDAATGFAHCSRWCASHGPCASRTHKLVAGVHPNNYVPTAISTSLQHGGVGGGPLTARRLPISDPDFKRQHGKFVQTWKHKSVSCPEVIGVFALRSTPEIDARFAAKRAALRGKSGTDGSQELFHGTRLSLHCTVWADGKLCHTADCGVCGITRTGFDKNRIGLGTLSQNYAGVSGNKKGFCRFGAAAYFAFDSMKAWDYGKVTSVVQPDGKKRTTVMVFEILLGKPAKLNKDDENLVEPPAGHDSVIGLTKSEAGSSSLNFPEACVYNVEQIMPRFVIFCKGSW